MSEIRSDLFNLCSSGGSRGQLGEKAVLPSSIDYVRVKTSMGSERETYRRPLIQSNDEYKLSINNESEAAKARARESFMNSDESKEGEQLESCG